MTINENERNSESEPGLMKRLLEDLKTEEELDQHLDRPLGQRDNLTHLPIHWLHRGREVLRIARAVIIRKHGNSSYKGTYVAIEVWRRYEKSQYFKKDSQLALTIEETLELLTYLRQA